MLGLKGMKFAGSLLLVVVALMVMTVVAVDVPYTNCGKAGDHVTITGVTADKWPPVKGGSLTMLFQGKTDEEITSGKYTVAITYSGIPLPTTTGPLSDLLALPVAVGPLTINSTSQFPSSSPSGGYVVQVSTADQNGAELFCTSVKFSLLTESREAEE